jgi:hypothetical protein
MIGTRSIPALAATLALLASSPVLAQSDQPSSPMGAMSMSSCPPPARFGGAVYCGAPKLTNTLALVQAGGGPKSFSTVTLFGVLAGDKASAEEAKLQQQFGKDEFAQFIKTFDFVIDDSLKIATEKGVALPAKPDPDPTDGKALSAALYADGIDPKGAYSVEYMLDHLVSHPIHVQVMKDIDAKYGLAADGQYHVVLLQVMKDLKSVYGL